MTSTIRPGSARAWAAGGVAAGIMIVIAGALIGLLAAQISQSDAEGWGALGLAVMAAFILPIGLLGAVLLLLGLALVMPRWAARLRTRGGERWAALLLGAIALAIPGLIVAVIFQTSTGNGGSLMLFGTMLTGISMVPGAIAGLLGWLVGQGGRDQGRPGPAITVPTTSTAPGER